MLSCDSETFVLIDVDFLLLTLETCSVVLAFAFFSGRHVPGNEAQGSLPTSIAGIQPLVPWVCHGHLCFS